MGENGESLSKLGNGCRKKGVRFNTWVTPLPGRMSLEARNNCPRCMCRYSPALALVYDFIKVGAQARISDMYTWISDFLNSCYL